MHIGAYAGLDPRHGLLPAWERFQPNTQAQLLDLAESYLAGVSPPELDWLRSNETPYAVLTGYWALQLLKSKAPGVFDNLPDGIWQRWASCLFWNRLWDKEPDDLHRALQEAAYDRAPEEFLQGLNEVIEGQKVHYGTEFYVQRSLPAWDDAVWGLLRSKLLDSVLRPASFHAVLSLLIQNGDSTAVEVAREQVRAVTVGDAYDLDKAIISACQLLLQAPDEAWGEVWAAMQSTPDFASGFLASLAEDPYGQASPLVSKLRESHLADIYILTHNDAVLLDTDTDQWVTPGKHLFFLRLSIINKLASRGTSAACREIRRIREVTNDEELKLQLKYAEDSARRNSWEALEPAKLIALAFGARASQEGTNVPEVISSRPNEAVQPSGEPTFDGSLDKSAGDERLFRKSGDYWELRFGGKSVHVRGGKGMRYIAELLRCPGLDIHVWQLLAAIEDQPAELGLGSAGIILDERTRSQFKARGEELMQELTEAKRNHNWDRQEEIEKELEQMTEQLASATGLGGRDRKASDDVERARKRVSRSINTAIRAIREHHQELADYLHLHVERGRYCCYRGDGLDWQL